MVKSGGRGYLLGDQGSAFRYGRDALLAYLNAPQDASTALRKTVTTLFGAEDEPSIVSRLYRAPSPQAFLAKLAKPLAADAKSGASYAVESLDRNAKELGAIIMRHLDRHLPSQDEVRVSLAGGLWKTSTVFIDALEAALRTHGLKILLERIKTPPVYGAVRLAQEMANGNRS